jgi:hypothetical protein
MKIHGNRIFLSLILALVIGLAGSAVAQPAAPVLSPTKGYSTFHPFEDMTFNWSPVPGAATYILQAAIDPSFPITSIVFNNIPNPTFSFATTDQGSYFARVIAVDANGVQSKPSNLITFTVFYNNPLPAPPSPISPVNNPTLTLPITLSWTDVPNPQPSGYEMQIAKDSNFTQIEDDVPQQNEPNRTELSLTPGPKFWRVRSSQGDNSPDTGAVTAWSATGTFTVNAAPPSPVSLTLNTNQFFSGNTSFAAIQLTSAVGANGSVINLTSSNPNVLSVPATVSMPANTAWTQFQVKAGQVTANTPVTITATMSSGTATAQTTILPISIKSIVVNPTSLNGGGQGQATISINGIAPTAGVTVSLSSSSPAVTVPASVKVPSGGSQAAAAVQANSVTANTPATITASLNGASVSSKITITPQGQPTGITLSPSTINGSGGSTAFISVAAPASTDQFFAVTSSNPAVAQVGNEVAIPAGSTTGSIDITTEPVQTQTLITITVSGGGVSHSATLTMNPIVAPTTRSLGVTAGGRAGESVISNIGGLKVPTGKTQVVQVPPGSVVTLSVTNGRDAIWAGACSSNGAKTKTCTLTVNADSPVTANVQ